MMSLVELALALPAERARGLPPQRVRRRRRVVRPGVELRRVGAAHERVPAGTALSSAGFRPSILSSRESFWTDRFRIVREVAQGGMGIVYEAVDEKLDRRIAIKCAKTGFRKRLPPEVRNASEISHPNVCKIFEIHTASHAAGRDRLSHHGVSGRRDARRAAPARAAAGRGSAHDRRSSSARVWRRRIANEVIHGDLKSNNVILTTGAGRSRPGGDHRFRPGAQNRKLHSVRRSRETLGGTPDYMAPELWKGEKASVASDIYALGVILYELASGRQPHSPERDVGGTAHSKTTARASAMGPLLTRCLDPDPARRFRDADAVGRALMPRSRRWLLTTAAAAIMALATGVVTYQRATVPEESVRFAMLPFETGPNAGSLVEGLSRDIYGQLARIRGSAHTRFTLIPQNKILNDHVATWQEAQTRLGATHVLHGTVRKENEELIIDSYITDTRSQVNVRKWTVEYVAGKLRYAPVAMAGMVTATLWLPPLAPAATVNAAAKQDYWNGLYYMRRDSTIDRALALLERAVTEDPDSALTYAALAEAQWDKYNILTKDRSWLEHVVQSERQAEIRNPDLQQVHQLLGSLNFDAGWYDQAAGEFLRAIQLDPKNSDAYRRLGMDYAANNEIDKALAAFHRAIEVGPENYRACVDFGTFLSSQSKYGEAAAYYRKAADLVPDEPGPHFALGSAYMDSGQYSDAENELRLAIGLHEPPTTAFHTLGVVLMYQGRDREAIQYITRALSLGPERHLWWMNLGTAYRRMNLIADSERANRRGLELAEADLSKNPRSGYSRSHLAYLYARLGDKPRAVTEIVQALQLSPNDADVVFMTAATYEALDLRDDTLALLKDAPGAVIADVGRWPDMLDLRKDPRFLKLLASRQNK